MLGIKNYTPYFFKNSNEVRTLLEKTFLQLLGHSIEEYYAQWDVLNNEWNEDGPIILMINGNQYEFTAHKLDYSLTINQIDLNQQLNWYGAGEDFPLNWKKNCFNEINSILNKPIDSVYTIDYNPVNDYYLVGFEFEFHNSNDCLHLSNALDCNCIKLYKTISDQQNRRNKLA